MAASLGDCPGMAFTPSTTLKHFTLYCCSINRLHFGLCPKWTLDASLGSFLLGPWSLCPDPLMHFWPRFHMGPISDQGTRSVSGKLQAVQLLEPAGGGRRDFSAGCGFELAPWHTPSSSLYKCSCPGAGRPWIALG